MSRRISSPRHKKRGSSSPRSAGKTRNRLRNGTGSGDKWAEPRVVKWRDGPDHRLLDAEDEIMNLRHELAQVSEILDSHIRTMSLKSQVQDSQSEKIRELEQVISFQKKQMMLYRTNPKLAAELCAEPCLRCGRYQQEIHDLRLQNMQLQQQSHYQNQHHHHQQTHHANYEHSSSSSQDHVTVSNSPTPQGVLKRPQSAGGSRPLSAGSGSRPLSAASNPGQRPSSGGVSFNVSNLPALCDQCDDYPASFSCQTCGLSLCGRNGKNCETEHGTSSPHHVRVPIHQATSHPGPNVMHIDHPSHNNHTSLPPSHHKPPTHSSYNNNNNNNTSHAPQHDYYNNNN